MTAATGTFGEMRVVPSGIAPGYEFTAVGLTHLSIAVWTLRDLLSWSRRLADTIRFDSSGLSEMPLDMCASSPSGKRSSFRTRLGMANRSVFWTMMRSTFARNSLSWINWGPSRCWMPSMYSLWAGRLSSAIVIGLSGNLMTS